MPSSLPYISVVSPVYQAEKLLLPLVQRTQAALEKITAAYEIILVEDGSTDHSWQEIAKLARQDTRIKGIKLSRNFGQHYAITAGLDLSRGDWVVVMDCDLQDQPEEIPVFLAKAAEGFEVVLAQRLNRKDKYFKKLFSRFFYFLLGYLTGLKQDSSIANFGLYSRKTIAAVNTLRESIRYFPAMVKWVGFRTAIVAIEHGARPEGSSSYSFKKLVNLALDIIMAYSDKPLRILVKTGILIAFFSFLASLIVFVRALTGHIAVLGYSSIIISIWFFSGILISIVGLVGLYIGKIFEGVKARPLYVIDRTTFAAGKHD